MTDIIVPKMKIEDEISHQIIGAAIEVHRILGGLGLLESIYESSLCHELSLRGLKWDRQKSIPVEYKGVIIKDPLILDILVENKVVIEIKSTEKEHPIFLTQILTYLRLGNYKLGLLVNFGKGHVKDGISRVVNGL